MRNLVAVLILVLPLGLSKAQSAPARPVEPSAIGVVYRLDPTSQELKRLPDEPWKESNDKFPPYDQFVAVSGQSSSFRIRSGERIDFVFQTGSPEKVSLYRLIQKKKKRQLYYEKNWVTIAPIKGLPADVSKYGESSYKLVPASPLAPGEYAINFAGEVYTFGVD